MRYCPGSCLIETTISLRISDVPAEIRTEHLQDTKVWNLTAKRGCSATGCVRSNR
jgi:hypothetical protein